jgi:hypothetical protein
LFGVLKQVASTMPWYSLSWFLPYINLTSLCFF